MSSLIRRLTLAALITVFAPGAIEADERILTYHSDIRIAADATMVVDESIRVRAEGNQIRRGIYRDFPTRYEDRFGNHYVVRFEVLSVERDGAPEPWRAEKYGNGVRVYVGSPAVFLAAGEYAYEIRYHTDRQIGYFDDHDELYWNVTGNGWGFAIDAASATVRLPGSMPSERLTMEGYTGAFGSSGRQVSAAVGAGRGDIQTTRVLSPGEGLTLVFSFPKGVVHEPDLAERVGYLLKDNLGLLLSTVTLLAVIGYLFMAWSRHGRDPEAGVVFAHYEPPNSYSPASARYVRKMGYDDKTLTAAVVNLAVKGHLTIDRSADDYQLNRSGDPTDQPLAPGEAALLKRLFEGGRVLKLEDENHATISAARSAHKAALKRDYYNVYFKNNSIWLLPSFLGSIMMLVLIALLGAFTPLVAGVAVGLIVVHLIFVFLMKAPTRSGRKLLDKLEGFALYLEVAEKDDLNIKHPPDLTPALFEQYLPFAIALGVEQAWAEQFAQVFAGLQANTGSAYRPGWYHGDFNYRRPASFANDVAGGFASAISSAATPPGSSSGGGGGGSSGGGGGGGGGGGW